MKALVYIKYGGPERLRIEEVEKPSPKNGEVLVNVHAASLNDWDWGLLKGDIVNRMLNGFLKPRRRILGSDIAGLVEAVGKGVTKFQVGDEVYGDLSGEWGGFAEYVCADEKKLCAKPPGMSFVSAAAIPQAAMLAVQGLIDEGKIQSGQKLLINGAGGCRLGTVRIQIAKLYGAETTGVDSTGKLDMLYALGFDHVIDYTQEDFTKNGQQYDLILDVKTNRSVFDYTKALTNNGTYVTVGGSLTRLLQVFLLGRLASRAGKKKLRIVALKTNKDLPYLNQLFEAGQIEAVIDGPYQLGDFAKAFRRFELGEHKGKIVFEL